VTPITADLSLRKPASSGRFCENCCAEGINERDITLLSSHENNKKFNNKL
jgi:hypothetical protein